MRNNEPVTSSPEGRGRGGGTGIGRALRAARAERGVSLGELESRTKIRAAHLAAFEDERFDDLPPYPYARGFLHTLALELGLDPEPLQRSFAEHVAVNAGLAETWRRLDGAVIPAVTPSRLRRVAMTTALVILAGGTAAAIFLFQQFRQFSEPAPTASPALTASPAPQQSPVSPSPDRPAVVPGDVASPPDRASPPTPGPPESPSPGPDVVVVAGALVDVDLQASGRSWVLVVIDGRTAFEGFMTAGDRRRWQGSTGVRVRVGNAGVIAATVNDRALGSLGRPGEVVDRTFSTRRGP